MTDNIHTAINKIMQEVGYVQKTGKVSGYGANYSYAGEAALIEAIRPSMVTHGVYMHVSKVIDVTRESYTTSKGTAMTNTIIQAMVTFTHAPSATSIETFACGEGSDSGDKGANKAMTGLYKYAMRQTFCIETGDDPDKQPSAEQERATTKAKPAANQKAKPAPSATLTLEEAEAITNSDGIEYGALETNKLKMMSNGIKKAISANSHPEKMGEYQTKLAAIEIIIKSRE